MSWEEGYDLGYYEGLRNCIRELIINQMNDMEWDAILNELRILREEALKQHQANIDIAAGEDL